MVLKARGQFGAQEPVDGHPPTRRPKGPTVAYGTYLAGWIECAACYGEDLSGGTSNIATCGPSLAGAKGFLVGGFASTMRTVSTPGGREMGNEMPWEGIGKLDAVSLTALYEYVNATAP